MKYRFELVQITYHGGEEVIDTFSTKQAAEKAEEALWASEDDHDPYTVFHIRKVKRSLHENTKH